jgi:hypothetical protein
VDTHQNFDCLPGERSMSTSDSIDTNSLARTSSVNTVVSSEREKPLAVIIDRDGAAARLDLVDCSDLRQSARNMLAPKGELAGLFNRH